MGESMKGMKRTHYCGEVTEKHLGETVTVMGWVNKRRHLSHLIFIMLRDRTGLVQTTCCENTAPDIYEAAKNVRGEYVLAIKGTVTARTAENINAELSTGKIEIDITELRVLSEAEVPPFQVTDTDVGMDLRLKHRYIDLRRTEMQNNLWVRHRVAQSARRFLSDDGFIEIETPVLFKSSPEGARDYLVASRVNPGSFYALVQSPQMMKQMLMVSGFDKYFQLAKCYRDEDLRADRQPEFTQIDIELSFADEEDIFALMERGMKKFCMDAIGREITVPFKRLPYREAMDRFGSDKPDMRFGLELKNLTEILRGCDFAAFSTAIENGGSVRGINAEGCADTPRKQIDAYVEIAKENKAKGLSWIVISSDGEIKTALSKFFNESKLNEIIQALDGKPGDLLFICSDKDETVFDALGALRCAVAKKRGLADENEFNFLWVTEMPLFEWSEEDGRFYAKHHPFTSPMEEDLPLPDSTEKRKAVRARAYDLVLNGYELGGGSIRIHRKEVQEIMFNALGFTAEDAQKAFGFFIDALQYGTPPHGGIALGLDRISMLFCGADSLREVIAFPKVKDASCPLSGAPSVVEQKQLDELGIKININREG
ncbi:MAG: aspartate--tRNA ligase [Defluviitaleaceae bacterium]|nr:aspartate--tRNA ligase [Defluviitaleaceae bacterium]